PAKAAKGSLVERVSQALQGRVLELLARTRVDGSLPTDLTLSEAELAVRRFLTKIRVTKYGSEGAKPHFCDPDFERGRCRRYSGRPGRRSAQVGARWPAFAPRRA